MTLLDIWAITTITNFYYRMKVNISIYKAYADLGYIFDGKRLKFIEDEESLEDNSFDWFIYKFGKFIPIYNLYQSLVRKFNYCIDAEENIKVFEECGIIEKMTTIEREEYNKKKTGMYAFKMRKKLNKRRKKLDVIVFSDGSSIYFNYKVDPISDDDLLNSIEIVEARGDLEGKDYEELKNIVYKCHFAVANAVINTYDNQDELFDNYNSDEEKMILEVETKEVDNFSKIEENIEELEVSKGIKKVKKR